ncbi:accessory protein regulator protein B [Ruminiclostridium hungatei]|uniref:Putative AgrB-like protein n=1 Tax=Ruminiclostridium hungatei TaxID=48256 RepID=A0A1V4SMZ7_RUMHU|nr:accessory gene regulator B family protein [Ruminiclostridium hungatei]OPX45183.1 accessory protein regulator protein B [Ruminiclostridium hungatei]
MLNKLSKQMNLVEKLTDFLVTRLNSHFKKEGLELVKMRLGMEILLINITKFIVVFSAAAGLNLFREALFICLVFGSIRKTAFGLHAKSSLVCTVSTFSMFVGGGYISHSIKLNNCMVFAAFLVMNILLYIYAPADTENHPLPQRQLREKLRKRTVATGIFLMILALLVPSQLIKSMMTLAVGFGTIKILPITYKIFNRGYRNYEKYHRAIC